MRASLLQLIIGAVLLGAPLAPARAAEPSAVGMWEQVDENSGKAESWFRIIEHNGVYEGTIIKIFFKPGESEDFRCEKCEGAERGAPVLGMKLIKGMHRHGNTYEDGTITDPRDGSVYHALLRLSADGPFFLGNVALYGAGIRDEARGELKPAHFVFPLNRALRAAGRNAKCLTITFVPQGPHAGAPVRVGSLAILVEEQPGG